MGLPLATYRLQFSTAFTFRQAREVVAYLTDLGISDLYASPIFAARAGSSHGYDVVDPNRLNPELGSEKDYRDLIAAARQLGLGWIQDIVPNHMAFDRGNPYLTDVLENGPASRYRDLFDIDWEHVYPSLHGRLLAPFLGHFFGDALGGGEIRLSYDTEGFVAAYCNLRFPLSIESYLPLLTAGLAPLRLTLGEEHPDYIQLLGVLYVLETLRTEPGDEDRYNQVKFVKNTLWSLHRQSQAVRDWLKDLIAFFNGSPDDPESLTPLEGLLAQQNFRLAFWKVATEEINYRRFFNLNDLICLRMDRPEIFDLCHRLILEEVEAGRFTGLRVDHLDGLASPSAYLEWLREAVGPATYLAVEKILDPREVLPCWPIAGTTGYLFLNQLNGLFIRTAAQRSLTRVYTSFTGLPGGMEDLEYEKKKLIIERHMMGDIGNLALQLKGIANRYRQGSDITLYSLRRSLIEIMASFPVYRTYLEGDAIRREDRETNRQALRLARDRNPGLDNEFDFIERVLMLEYEDFLPVEEREQWAAFVRRFQQFTGPLMAKGFEDTLLYVYNRLLSLNEVGGSPEHFGLPLQEFHRYIRRRQQQWPQTMNATATHDTKRGEDVRARLNVLSEIPREWGRQLKSWSRLTRPFKGRVGRRKFPDRNDEYFLYQILLGTWPAEDFDRQEYRRRLHEYMLKAVREAKIHTAWLKPDSNYEEAYLAFLDALLDPEEGAAFQQEFLPFARKIARLGIFNSLAQTLLKMTAPGIPDFYQGTEFWDFNLVDPDNRRPVDFTARRRTLAALTRSWDQDRPALLVELLAKRNDGRIKQFLIHRTLLARRQRPELFSHGGYRPLEAAGPRRTHLIAFTREYRGERVAVIAPRFLAGLVPEGDWPWPEDLWGETTIELPGSESDWGNELTGKAVAATGPLKAAEILKDFPVALLVAGTGQGG